MYKKKDVLSMKVFKRNIFLKKEEETGTAIEAKYKVKTESRFCRVLKKNKSSHIVANCFSLGGWISIAFMEIN